MVWFVMTRALLRSGVGVSGLASGRESDWCTSGAWCGWWVGLVLRLVIEVDRVSV